MILPHNFPNVNKCALDDGRPIYATHRGRRVVAGHVRGAVFYRQIQRAHVLQKPPALCLNAETLDDLANAGVTTVVVIVDGQATYTCALAEFRAKQFPIDRDGPQCCLPLNRWQVASAPGQTTTTDKPAMTQPSLFGGAK